MQDKGDGADIWKRFQKPALLFSLPKSRRRDCLMVRRDHAFVWLESFDTSHDLTAIAPVPAQSGRQSVDSCRESHWTPAGLGVLFSEDGLSKTDRSVLRLALPRGVPAVAAS